MKKEEILSLFEEYEQALFHYRYIRIHPFEDGNGRIARLLMNYILAKHDYPMLVIRSKTKKNYLDALGKADKQVGPIPSDGANATLEQANAFVTYISHQMEETIENNLRFIAHFGMAKWAYRGVCKTRDQFLEHCKEQAVKHG